MFESNVRDRASKSRKEAAMSLRILLIEDSDADAELILRQLVAGLQYFDWCRADSREAAEQHIAEGSWDVVLSDYQLPRFNALSALAKVRQHDRHVPFIIVSGTIGEATAVEALKLGADDYIMKGNLARLVPAIKRELEVSQIRRNKERAELALHESDRRFRHMLANIELVSVMLDREGRILYCNDYLLRLTGWQGVNLVGQSWYGLFIPLGLEQFQRTFDAQLAEEPSASHEESEILTRSGERLLIRWSTSTLHSSMGDVIGIASIGEDITQFTRQQAELSHAHRRMQALTQRLIKLQETERRALAADLHDYVGQNLSALGINLSMLEAHIPVPSPQHSAILDDSRSLMEGIGRAIWRLISELRAEVPAGQSLLTVLRQSAEKFEQRTSIATTVTGSEERLPPAVEAALLRVVLEAMSNTAKHAEAKHIVIKLRTRPQGAALWIIDDGKGYDPLMLATPGKRSRWGLMMMRERIESLGGRLRIMSAPGKGTCICATWHGSE